MIEDKLKEIVQQACGIDASILGFSMMQQILRHRMAETAISNRPDYLAFVMQNQDELQKLLNMITVPETWFFRDEKPFEFFVSWVRNDWEKMVLPGKKLEILSVPCASGEEPYSIAISLMEAGFSLSEFHIDAIDINTRMLEFAQRGVYGRQSFRSKNERSMHYFKCNTNGDFALEREVKDAVVFHHGDMLKTPLLMQSKHYDAIFCRNLLIYFNKETQKKAVGLLEMALADEGLLFVGHAETHCCGDTMILLQDSQSIFCLKKNTSTRSTAKGGATRRKINKLDTEPAVNPPKISSRKDGQKPLRRPQSISLQDIKKAYDCGQIILAARYCEKFLALNPESADGYYILALIRQASSNQELALELFRKTIYLNPEHQRAMMHLAALLEIQGDKNAAAKWRARARRVSEQHE